MKQAEIKALLEKYWQAETTLEEERQLAEYFRQPEITAGLEPAREVFAWREEEAELRPGPDFDRQLLERIGKMGSGGTLGFRGRVIGGFRVRFAAAAAIILCLGIGLLIPIISPKPGGLAVSTTITDTYADPQEALTAVRQALLLASTRINEGKHITQKSITHLHDSWQAATGD